MRCIGLFIALLLTGFANAQSDTTEIITQQGTITTAGKIKKPRYASDHSPGRAALYSAVLPGAGQLYNKKYWKIPLVVVAFGTAAFFVVDNQTKMQGYIDERLFRLENPGMVNTFPNLNENQLRIGTTFHRRYRDISYASIALIWIVNILDANVDAFMIKFDVSDDISFELAPQSIVTPQMPHAVGLGLTIKL
ncbi:MAG: DUF5683 domain-containing protein [Luteibaculaceae bacterium]